MGFFGMRRKSWRHPDPQRRLAGLRDIRNDQQQLLAEIATDDNDAAVRRAAVARIHKPDLLQGLLGHHDEAVATAARQRLSGSVVDLIKTQDHERVGSLLDQITEQSALAEIALQAKDERTRAWACERLCTQEEPSPAMLARVAIQDADGAFAADCIERLDKLAQLKEVAKKAKHEQARSLASQRVKAIREDLDKPSPEQRRRARREALEPLVAEARRHAATSSDLQAAEQGLASVIDERDRLMADDEDLEVEEECRQQLDAIERSRETCFRRLAEHRRERAAQEAAERTRDEILSDLEAALADDHADAVARLGDFERRWAASGEATPERGPEFERRWDELRVRCRPASSTVSSGELPAADPRASLSAEEQQQLEDILEQARAAASGEDLRSADQRLKALHKQWNQLAGGLDRDDPRRQAFNDCYQGFKERRAKANQEREVAIEQRLERMSELVRGATELADDGLAERDANAGLAALKALKQSWRDVGRVPRHRLQEPLQTFNEACERVQVQLRAAHQERDWERFANATRAEELIEAIGSLVPAADEALPEQPEEVLERIKTLQAEWKGLGYFPRERKEDLWQRYKAAGDRVYERLQPFFAERDEEREINHQAKEKLLEELRDLVEMEQPHGIATGLVTDESPEARRARGERVKAIQDEWKAIGQVPRDRYRAQQAAYRQQLDRFYQGRRIQHQHAEEERQDNLVAKQALVERAAALGEKVEQWQAGKIPGLAEPSLLDEVKALQREWRGIGFVPREHKDSIYAAFRAACDTVYAALEPWFKRMDEERADNLEAKRNLLRELEELCEEERPDWFRDEAIELRHRWQEIGHVPRDHAKEINGRYQELCDRILGSSDRRA